MSAFNQLELAHLHMTYVGQGTLSSTRPILALFAQKLARMPRIIIPILRLELNNEVVMIRPSIRVTCYIVYLSFTKLGTFGTYSHRIST